MRRKDSFENVVFTCGCLVDGDRIAIYYGAADDKNLQGGFIGFGIVGDEGRIKSESERKVCGMKKRVTMKEIADRLNLSINAVSLALNDRAGVSEETRRLVLNAAEEMDIWIRAPGIRRLTPTKNICILLKTVL